MELDSEGLDSPVKVIACQEVGNSDVYEVEKITGMRLVKGKLWFRVRWKGYGADMATWEPRVNLTHCEELLDDYVSKVQDKKYKQKKRRQTRNALIHSREKELKKGPNHVVKNKVPFNGPIRRKRFIRKFISKPNRCFKQMAQTKWPVNGGHLETVSATKLVDLPLETAKEKEPVDLPLETAMEKEPVDLPLETATEKEPVDLPLETATEKEPVDLLLQTAKEKEQRRGGRARRRGRPKKNPVKMPDLQPQTQLCPDREPLETVDDVIILENNSIPEQKLETVVKRSRGRPPKRRITEQEEKLPVQSDLYGQERPKDIVRKRGRPKKVVADEGVTKETTHHPYNGQIKLKKVVIRELRSLKALLEFQRQISDEEKENHTDTYPKEENPSTMENRHVLATEYRKRFYIRIKTGSFKDQSEKRRRKRKEHKEKRRKKKEAVQMKVRTDGDLEKNGLVDKQRVCDEIQEDKRERCHSLEVMEIGSSEVENRNEDSVESQLHAPALNEEYDQFGYDDFVDFSKENNHVRDIREKEDDTDAEPLVPQVSEEMDIDGREMPRDEIVAIESDTVLSAPNLRPERLVEEDAVTKEEEKIEEEEEEKEEARAADDESSSLVIPFDDDEEEEEEEESSSLIICEDGMEDDDDDDDDDLREFEIENNAIQEPQTAVTESFTTGSMDNVEKEIAVDATRVDDQELTKAEHCEKSSEDVDSDEFIIEEKLTNEETESKQKETEATNLEAMSSNDSLREEILSKLFERECNCGKNHEDMTHLDQEKDAVTNVVSGKLVFTEEGSHKLDVKQDSQIDAAVEIVNEDQIERGDATSGRNFPLETENEVQVSISAKDKIDIDDEESIRTSQMEEEECAKEVIKSGIISKTDNEEVDSLEGMETVANIERMEEESCESKEEREGQGDQIEPLTTVLSKGKATEEEMRRDDDKTESALTIVKEREINQNDLQEGEKQMEDLEKEVKADVVITSETSSKVAQDAVEVHNSTTETETVEQDCAVEGMDSRIEHEETDDDGRTVKACVEQTEEKCTGKKEEERATNIDLSEPEVKVPSEKMEIEAEGQVEDKEIESKTTTPHGFLEDETSKENLEEALDESCTTEPMNPGILPIKVDKEVDSIERQGKEVCVEESEEEFEMEEERELEDILVEPQVNSIPEGHELERKVQADDRHVESKDAVTQEKEFDMEEERELEDDLVEPQVNSIPEAQELKGKLQADDRHMESEDAVTQEEEFDMEEEKELGDDLVEPQVKGIPEAQELKGKLLANDRPVESEGTVSPEEFEMEEEREVGDDLVEPLVKSIPKAQELERKVHADDRQMEPEEVEDDLIEPQAESTPEAQELERLVQADDRHVEPEDAVTQEEEFVVEDERKVKDDLAEPQVKSIPEAEELEREVQADDRHMEPEDAVTQEEEFVIEDKKKVKDDFAEPQVKSVPEAQELKGKLQADDRHVESEGTVSPEEFEMEEETEVGDDLVEPLVKSIPKAQELERKVHADDRQMEPEEVEDDLVEPKVKSTPEAQELERLVQADDRHMEPEDAVTQEEEFVIEDEKKVKDDFAEPPVKSVPETQELEREVQTDDGHMESEDSVTQEEFDKEDKRKVKDDLAEPQVKSVPEAQEIQREVQADDRHMESEDSVTQEEFDMEDKREVKDGLTEPQVKNVPEAQELEREVQADIRHMEPEDSVTPGMAEKVLHMDEETDHTKNAGDVPLRASNDMQPDTTTARESNKIKDDQGECDKEEINTELKETGSQMSGVQENRQKELENNEEREQKNDIPPQRDIESLKKPELERSPEMENEEEKAEGETCHEKMEEKEGASDGKGREEVACDDKMEEKSGMEVQLKSMDIEGKTHAEGEKESEMAVAMETIENTLRQEEEVEHEINNVPQREDDKISPDFTTSKETDVECSDHGERDIERRKTGDEEKKSEIGGASEIADKELKMVEELESDVDNMSQRDTENLEPGLLLTKERDIEENNHQEKDRKQVENQKEEQKTDRLRTSGAVSAMAGDAVDSGVKDEMEVEEKGGQMDCETVSPEKDETGCHEGGDDLSMATTTEEEKMVTSTKESVKDQVMRKEDDQEVDEELNSGKEEAAETVKEQVVEFGDHQNMDVQELPDLPLKDNKNPEQECNVDKSVAESEGEAKTSEDENKSKEGDRALESCEEATATEASTAEDTVHSVVEDKGQTLETRERSGEENIEDIIENYTKGNHNEDKESIHGAEMELRNEDRESIHKAGTELRNEDKESIHSAETELGNEDKESIPSTETELGNELLKGKRVEEEMVNSYNSMGDADEVPLIVTKTDVEEKENNEIKSVDRRTEIEISDEGIVDEQENRCSNDKQMPFPDKMGNAENRTSGNAVPLIVTKADVVEKENDDIKPVDRKAAIEIIDEGIADEQENRCGIDKQILFPDKMEKAKNTASENLESIQQLVMEEKVEDIGNVLNGSRPNIQEVDLQEKMELNVVDRKKTDARDGLKIMEEEELEEGEIPDDEEEEEREDDDKDDDKEEGEIMEEIEDVAEERGRADEIGEKTQPLEKSKDTDQNSENEFSNSQEVEPARRRRSQEAIEIAKTSSINSDLRTTRHVAERTMTTRSSAITMKRNFNGAYSSREYKRAKTIEPSDAIAVDDEDDDDVEVVESNIHPKKNSQSSHDKNSAEKDVYIIGEEPAKSAGAKPHDNRSNFSEHVSETSVNYEQNSEALSPKFGAGLKKVSPASSWHVGRKDKTGSNARRMVQSMKDHLLHNVSNSQESGENGQTVIKNSSCKAQGVKPKDSFAKEGRENLFKRLEGPGSGDAGTRTGKSGTKRKSDDDDDNSGSSGSKTQPKKKLAGISGKEVWRMVPRKEKKPTEPIWEGNTKINRQKIVIKISKVHLPDQHGTKELEDNSKSKESEKSEKSSSHNGWKEGRKAEKTSEDKGCHGGLQASGVKEEQKEKREKMSLNVRDRRASSTSTDATGRWSAVPDAKLDNRTGSETGRKSRRASETNAKPDLIKDLKELKTHGIKQSDLPWVKDLLETDHTECLSEACAALTKFMDSKDHKINLVVEMGFCPMLVKLLRSRSAEVVSSALLAVSHIVSGNDYQTQAVLECSPLPLFSSFLSRHKHDVMLRKEACLALSNITAGTSQQIQHLVNDGLFPVLLSVMQHDEAQVMYEATWAVANATVNGSPEQIRYIVKQGFFQAFSEVLKHTDDTLIQIALDAMYNVLKLDAKNKKPGKPTPYCRQVKEFGGLERIRSVRQTGSTVVKKKADNMLRTFFCDL